VQQSGKEMMRAADACDANTKSLELNLWGWQDEIVMAMWLSQRGPHHHGPMLVADEAS